MNRHGLLIALSGVDCAGKSTQRGFLLDALRAVGRSPVTLWTRVGYTPRMEAAKRALRSLRGRRKSTRRERSASPGRYPRRACDLRSPLVRRLWLAGSLLELLWIYAVRIRLWRARGRTIVCDRYLLDCLVDLRVNFPDDRAERTWPGRLLRRFSVRPDVSCCLMVDAERSLQRARQKARHHWETLEVLRARRREYERASRELEVDVVDGARPAPGRALARSRLAEHHPGAGKAARRAGQPAGGELHAR
jgi:thymidylate kinase